MKKSTWRRIRVKRIRKITVAANKRVVDKFIIKITKDSKML